jgi:signal transduction histidine kinase
LNDQAGAAGWYRARSKVADPEIRAGALAGLARSQVRLGRDDDALATLEALAPLGPTRTGGLPAGLIALVMRGEILDRAERPQDLAATGKALRAKLASGGLRLIRDEYEHYMALATRWADADAHAHVADPAHIPDSADDAEALAMVLDELYQRWRTDGAVPRRHATVKARRTVLVAADASGPRLALLLAGSDRLTGAWRDMAGVNVALVDASGDLLVGDLLDAPDSIRAVRSPDVSGLPWTIRVASRSLDADRAEAVEQRQFLLLGVAAVVLLLGGSAYFTLRGFYRELAVSRMQADFVAAVSHEFRTPLASVRHLSDLLVSGRMTSDQDRQQSYAILARESERLETLVDNLLDFGRLESGSYQYRMRPVEAPALVAECIEAFRPDVEARGHRVDFTLDASNVVINADREALARAIWNLLDNAVKYSPGAEIVRVSLRQRSEGVALSVADDGLGVSASEHDAIFGRFVRGSNATGRRIRGTGIGLAMVRHIVEAHGGRISLASEPGKGSTFTIDLPAAERAHDGRAPVGS